MQAADKRDVRSKLGSASIRHFAVASDLSAAGLNHNHSCPARAETVQPMASKVTRILLACRRRAGVAAREPAIRLHSSTRLPLDVGIEKTTCKML
jgi:hypothetical protein